MNELGNREIQYVVTPGEMPATKWEYAQLMLFRKFSLFPRAAAGLYEQEMDRILPGIRIASIANYSNDPKFVDICRALKASSSNDKP